MTWPLSFPVVIVFFIFFNYCTQNNLSLRTIS
ncbi:hypothetical protein [Dickeya oryzae]